MRKPWKNHIRGIIAIVMLPVLLACNLEMDILGLSPRDPSITITDVAVTPPSGRGDFTLTLSYRHPNSNPVTVSCYYSGPDKNNISIMVVDDTGKTGYVDITQTKDFSIRGVDGKAVPGVYSAICSDEDNLSTKTAIFTVAEDAGADVSIVDVQVAEGQKYSYALEFAYTILIPEDVAFTCNYLSPDGATFPIGNFIDSHHLQGLQTKSMFFSVKRADGKVVPGTYTATCQDDEGRSKKSTGFVVVEEATATPEPSDTPKPPVSGRIVFDYSNAESSRGSAGGELKRVTEQCIPNISISPNGNFSSQCEKLNFKGLLEKESVTAWVEGAVDLAGNFNFTYEVTEIGSPNGAWRITYTGRGMRSDGGTAEGMADFGYNCNSGSENLVWCWKWTSESFSGKIPWRFDPSP